MKALGNILIGLSIVAIILSIVGSFGHGKHDIWLASTQWVLIAATLGIYALYVKEG